jgi:hypothetical protein
VRMLLKKRRELKFMLEFLFFDLYILTEVRCAGIIMWRFFKRELEELDLGVFNGFAVFDEIYLEKQFWV